MIDDALVENEVDEANDGRGVRRVLHRRDVVDVRGREPLVVAKPLAKRLDHVRDGIVRVAVVLGDAVHHVLLAGEDEPHLLREREEHLVCNARVDEVEGRERDRRLVGRHGKDIVHARRGRRDRLGDLGVDRHAAEVYRLGVLIGGENAEKVVLRKNLLVEHRLAYGLALGLGGIGELLRGHLIEVSVLDENLQDRIAHTDIIP